MNDRPRRWLFAVLSILTCSLTALALSIRVLAADATSVVPCTSAQLHGEIVDTTSTNGRDATLLSVANVGRENCTVGGYPGIQFIAPHGVVPKLQVRHVMTVPLGGGAHRRPVAKVILGPGAEASFWLEYADGGASGPTGCETAFQLLLRTSKANVQILPRTGVRWCGPLEETPLVAGNSGSLPAKPLATFFGQDRPCLVSQLVARPGAPVAGGLGHDASVILFQNVSDFACTLRGYPRVLGAFAGAKRGILATATVSGYMGGWGKSRGGKLLPIPTVTLGPRGGTASVRVEALAGRTPTCPEITTFWSTIPGGHFALSDATALPVCEMSSLAVHPFVPGKTGTVN
jgi:hypothetical protein